VTMTLYEPSRLSYVDDEHHDPRRELLDHFGGPLCSHLDYWPAALAQTAGLLFGHCTVPVTGKPWIADKK
jgi:hypothetical protein